MVAAVIKCCPHAPARTTPHSAGSSYETPNRHRTSFMQLHVRLQSTANILGRAFSAASVKMGPGVVFTNTGKCRAVDTSSAFRLSSHFTHLRRALTQTP